MASTRKNKHKSEGKPESGKENNDHNYYYSTVKNWTVA